MSALVSYLIRYLPLFVALLLCPLVVLLRCLCVIIASSLSISDTYAMLLIIAIAVVIVILELRMITLSTSIYTCAIQYHIVHTKHATSIVVSLLLDT